MLSFPPFRLDLDEERLWKGATLLTVRRKPFAILRHLAENAGRLVTHDDLLKGVWGGAVVSDSAVRTHLHELRQLLGEGVIETVIGRGYRFTAALADPAATAAARVEVAAVDRLVVGRGAELEVLRAALERAHTGHRQLCFLTGEPGIGKTTLVEALLDTVGDRPDVVAVRGHCVEQHGTPEAYLAVIEVLSRLRQSAHGDRVCAALVRHAPTFAIQVPQLVPDGQLEEVARRAHGGNEAKLVRELLEALEAMSEQHTLVVVLEDLQWSDVATLDLLALLGQRRERARLMVIATSRRAEAQTVAHPLNRVMRNLVARSGAVAVPLDRVAAGDIRRFMDIRFGGHAFGDPFIAIVDRITAGTPLFLVSFVEDLVARGMLAQRDGRWVLTVAIDEVAAHRPDSVKQLIDLQLDRLTPAEQRVLEVSSVIGPAFATALVAAAVELSVEDTDEICDGLARRALFLRREATEDWPDGTTQTRYAVIHALVHEVCLERTVMARRQRWHRAIADHLERAHHGRSDEISHLLAMHYDRGQSPRAAAHQVVAAERTAQRFASSDAMRMYQRALALLPRLPDGAERDALELRVLGGMSHAVIRSADDASQVPFARFERMIALARRLDDVPQLFAALINLSLRYSTLAQYRDAAATSDQLDAIAQTSSLPPQLTALHATTRAVSCLYQGDLQRARPLLEGLTAADVAGAVAPGILGPTDRITLLVIYLGVLYWQLGQPDRAMHEVERAIARAQRSGDPYTVGAALCNLARVRFWRRDPPRAMRDAAELVLAMPDVEVWHPQATLLAAWAASQDAALAPAEVDRLVELFRARVAKFPMGTTFLAILVIGVLRGAGQLARAAALTDEMLAFAGEHDERLFEPELARLRGELLEATDPGGAADAYLAAISQASAMASRSLELRAANRLARLWHRTERRSEAIARVAAALAPFREGLDTADLIEARALLG